MPVYVFYNRPEVYQGANLIHSLRWHGSLPGCVVVDAAGANGPGTGCLRWSGTRLYWRPPGSTLWGSGLTVTTDGTYYVAGVNPSQWVAVEVYTDYLPSVGQTADVELKDRYDNYATAGDVAAEDAAAGCVREYELTVKQTHPGAIFLFRAWLGGGMRGGFADPYGWMMGLGGGVGRPTLLEISADGINWSQPVDYAGSISIGAAAYEGTVTLYVRETVPAGAAPDPEVLQLLHVSYQAVGVNKPVYIEEIRGLYRIFNAAEYRFYRSQAAPPELTDAPYAVAPALPATPTDTFGDGTWFLSATWFNGVWESGFLPLDGSGHTYLRLDVDAGAEVGTPPGPVSEWRLEPRPAGVVRVVGFAGLETGDTRADEWAIAYTIDGSDPTPDSPDVTVEWTDATSIQFLAYDLPAAADGVTLKVLLQTRRNDGTEETPVWVYSEDATVLSVVVDATGPTAPIGADRWGGVLARVE